jgi:hypothetical protein
MSKKTELLLLGATQKEKKKKSYKGISLHLAHD